MCRGRRQLWRRPVRCRRRIADRIAARFGHQRYGRPHRPIDGSATATPNTTLEMSASVSADRLHPLEMSCGR